MTNEAKDLNKDMVAAFYAVMARHLGEDAVCRLRHHMELQYRDIRFDGTRVIDIGGGNGIHSFYAAALGAKEVVVIEPEDAGSTAAVVSQFNKWKDELGDPNVDILTTTFQEYDPEGRSFDIILIQDAINHLDEGACSKLSFDQESQEKFMHIFLKLASIAHVGTILHFSDCSSRNFYPAVGLSNPFDPGIEWEKHQPPSVWIGLLEKVGFKFISKRWSSPTKLGELGKIIFGNSMMNYFFTSHFIVTMKMK